MVSVGEWIPFGKHGSDGPWQLHGFIMWHTQQSTDHLVMTLSPTYGRSWGYLGMLYESAFTTVVTSKCFFARRGSTHRGRGGRRKD